MKKLVQGVGDNDIPKVSGKVYTSWTNMINRGYNSKYHVKKPTYKGVTVHEDWLTLSKFKSWYDSNYVDGYHLDKDILKQGNKQYCSEYCRFVPSYVNTVLIDCGVSRGDLPIGVCVEGTGFKSQCSQLKSNGVSKQVNLGRFKKPEEAHQAWQHGKIKAIELVIDKYRTEPNPLEEIINALQQRIEVLKHDIKNGLETIKL